MFHGVAKAKVVKFGLMHLEAKTDVTQGVAAGELPEEQMQQLVVACQVLGMPVAMVLGDGFVKLVSWKKIHNLGKNIATDIHNLAVLDCKITQSISNQKIEERSETLINKGICVD
jgi:hypothetical protein